MAHIFEVYASNGCSIFTAIVVTNDERHAVTLAKCQLGGRIDEFAGAKFDAVQIGTANRETMRGARAWSVTPIEVHGIDPAVSC